jgi:hypothetical protein
MKHVRLISNATVIGCAFVSVILFFNGAPARADVQVRIDIGNAPPPPRFVFRARPHEVFFPEQRVYVVDDPGIGDEDCFRYGGYYWVFRDGYWYRSAAWRGPFRVVNPRYVPTVFYRVPATRWKHHPNGPPRFAQNRSGYQPAPTRDRRGYPPAPTRDRRVYRQPPTRDGGGYQQTPTRDTRGNSPAPTRDTRSNPPAPTRDHGGGPPGLEKKGAGDHPGPPQKGGGDHQGSKKKGSGDHPGPKNGGDDQGSKKKGGGGTPS